MHFLQKSHDFNDFDFDFDFGFDFGFDFDFDFGFDFNFKNDFGFDFGFGFDFKSDFGFGFDFTTSTSDSMSTFKFICDVVGFQKNRTHFLKTELKTLALQFGTFLFAKLTPRHLLVTRKSYNRVTGS